MILLLYGPDSYRRNLKLKELISEYQSKHSVFSVDYFDLEETDEVGRLKDFCRQRTMFGGKKLAVVKNPSSLAQNDLKELAQLLKNELGNEDNVLIISENNDLAKELDFLYEKAFKKQEFRNLEGEQLKFFLEKELKNRGINLSPAALNFLVRNFQNNTWGLLTAIGKLESWGEKIDLPELEQIGGYFETPNIYEFVDAVSRKKPLSHRIAALEKLLSAEEEPAKIFNFLASSYYLDFEKIRELADEDVKIKSGKTDYETALLEIALIN